MNDTANDPDKAGSAAAEGNKEDWYKKQLGQQANEIGQLRTAITQFIETKDSELLSESFDSDQLSAIDKVVNAKLRPLQESVSQASAAQAQDKLTQKHPDWESVVNTPKFQAWVESDPVVNSAYEAAIAKSDIDTGIALLDKFKSDNPSRPSQDVLDTALSSTRGSSGDAVAPESGIYSRAAIRHLKMTDPAKYRAQSAEILRAYGEGRVR